MGPGSSTSRLLVMTSKITFAAFTLRPRSPQSHLLSFRGQDPKVTSDAYSLGYLRSYISCATSRKFRLMLSVRVKVLHITFAAFHLGARLPKSRFLLFARAESQVARLLKSTNKTFRITSPAFRLGPRSLQSRRRCHLVCKIVKAMLHAVISG